jgi:hypothetical protein
MHACRRPYTEAFPQDDEIDGVDLSQALGEPFADIRANHPDSTFYHTSSSLSDRLKVSDSQVLLQPSHNSLSRSDAGAVVDEILRAAGSHPSGSMASLPAPLATGGRLAAWNKLPGLIAGSR